MHCSNLGADALHKAIEDYREKEKQKSAAEEAPAGPPAREEGRCHCPYCDEKLEAFRDVCKMCKVELEKCPACGKLTNKAKERCTHCGTEMKKNE
jgi:nitrogen fixation NifU-like protein